MSAQAPFGSPQAPKEGNRRAAASVKPSPRKQKVQATAKRAASSSAPESTRSPQKERAEVRKPEDSAHSFDKYAFDVDNLLEDIEQKEHQDANRNRSSPPRSATVSQSKFERDELAEKMNHLEQTNRTLRSSLLEQMKIRKKEEEAFMSTLISEKNKANKWIAKLHLKLEKRESLLLAWAQLAHALLSRSPLDDPTAIYEKLYETSSLVLGSKLDSLQIAPAASRSSASPKKTKKKAKRSPQVRLFSSDEDTDLASDASPSPRKPRSGPQNASSRISEGEDEETEEEKTREEVPENQDDGTADDVSAQLRRKLRLDGGHQRCEEPSGRVRAQATGKGERRLRDPESGEDDEEATSLAFLVQEDNSLKKRLASLEKCLGNQASDPVMQALDAVQGHIHGNSLAIENLLAQEARDVIQSQSLASGGADEGANVGGLGPTSSLGSSRSPVPSSLHPMTTTADSGGRGGVDLAREEHRASVGQEHLQALPSRHEYTYDQLLQEVLRSVSSAASSSVALDETLELSSSINKTDDMIQKILIRRPTLQTSSATDRVLPSRALTDSEKLRLGGCLDGDHSLSLEGST